MRKNHIIERLFALLCLLTILSQPVFSQTEEDVKALKQKAKSGDKTALYQLGKLNELGIVEKQSFKKAFEYYEQSALLEYDSAQMKLANLYETGRGTTQNFRMAFTLYKRAAKQGNAEAVYKLAKCYEDGLGTPVDKQKSAELYLQALNAGHGAAEAKIQKLPVDSLANPGDFNYIKAKADRGIPEFQYQLAEVYAKGDGEIKQDLTKARLMYYKASKAGYAPASFELGKIYAQGKGTAVNERLAAKYLLEAASKGIEDADQELEKFDLEKLLGKNNFDLVRRNARIGVPADLFEMAKRYEEGREVEQNFDSALFYCQKAAIAGNENAMLTLGKWYETGKSGVKQNYENAFKWYSGAVAMKNDSAYFLVAEFYEKGQGIKQDMAKAARYYVKSAIRGKKEASKRLALIDNLDAYFNPHDVEYIYYKALQGDKEAEVTLAKYLALGNDNQQTVYWMEKAAESNAEMQYKLAKVYRDGEYGAEVNFAKALKYYEQAANSGKYPEALLETGMMYANQEGTAAEDHYVKALTYLNKYKSSGIKIDRLKKAKISSLQAQIYYNKQDYGKASSFYGQIVNGFKADWKESKSEPTQEMLDELNLVFDALINQSYCNLYLKKYETLKSGIKGGVKKLEEFKEEARFLGRLDELNGKFYYFDAKYAANKGDTRNACLYYEQAINLAGLSDEDLDKVCNKGQ